MKAANLAWYVPPTSGTPPSPRTAHSAVMVGTRAFILFGKYLRLHDFVGLVKPGDMPSTFSSYKIGILFLGQTSNTTVDNNIYALDTTTWTWMTTYTPDHLEYTATWLYGPNSSTSTPTTTTSYTTTGLTIAETIGLTIGIVAFFAIVGMVIFIIYRCCRSDRPTPTRVPMESTLQPYDPPPIGSLLTTAYPKTGDKDRTSPILRSNVPSAPSSPGQNSNHSVSQPVTPSAQSQMRYPDPSTYYAHLPPGYPIGYPVYPLPQHYMTQPDSEPNMSPQRPNSVDLEATPITIRGSVPGPWGNEHPNMWDYATRDELDKPHTVRD